eukprot:5834498-Amphidinium_carterae.2
MSARVRFTRHDCLSEFWRTAASCHQCSTCYWAGACSQQLRVMGLGSAFVMTRSQDAQGENLTVCINASYPLEERKYIYFTEVIIVADATHSHGTGQYFLRSASFPWCLNPFQK